MADGVRVIGWDGEERLMRSRRRRRRVVAEEGRLGRTEELLLLRVRLLLWRVRRDSILVKMLRSEGMSVGDGSVDS